MIATLLVAAMLMSPTAASAGATRYSTAQTPIGVLLADPVARSILARYFPEFTASGSVTSGRANRFTIRSIKKFRPRLFTDARLAAADAELARLPVRQGR